MSSITIRVDEADKKAVEQIFKDIGLNISSATNAFFKQVIMHGGIPFELKSDPFYSKQNIKRLEKSAKEIEKNGGETHDLKAFYDEKF